MARALTMDELLDPEILLPVASSRAAYSLGLDSDAIKEILFSTTQGERSNSSGLLEVHRLFLRLYHALNGYFSGDIRAEQNWLVEDNLDLQGIPSDLIRDTVGLQNVVQHLEMKLMH